MAPKNIMKKSFLFFSFFPRQVNAQQLTAWYFFRWLPLRRVYKNALTVRLKAEGDMAVSGHVFLSVANAARSLPEKAAYSLWVLS